MEKRNTAEIEQVFESTKDSLDKFIKVLQKNKCRDVHIKNQKMIAVSYLYMTRALYTEYCKNNGDTIPDYLPAGEPDLDISVPETANTEDSNWSSRLLSGVRDSILRVYSTINTIVSVESDETLNGTIIPTFVTCEGDYFSKKLEEILEDFLAIIDQWKPRNKLVMQNKRAIVEKICSTEDIFHFTEENVKTTTASSIWPHVLKDFMTQNQEKTHTAYFSGLCRRKGSYFHGLIRCMIELHKELCNDNVCLQKTVSDGNQTNI